MQLSNFQLTLEQLRFEQLRFELRRSIELRSLELRPIEPQEATEKKILAYMWTCTLQTQFTSTLFKGQVDMVYFHYQ